MEAVVEFSCGVLPPALHARVREVAAAASEVHARRAAAVPLAAAAAASLAARGAFVAFVGGVVRALEARLGACDAGGALELLRGAAPRAWDAERRRNAAGRAPPAPDAAMSVAVGAFRAALGALEGDIDAVNAGGAHGCARLRVPWQLANAADSTFGGGDGDGGESPSGGGGGDGDGQTVEYGGTAINKETGLSNFEDACGACGWTIQDGLLRGVGEPRVHCLECTAGSVCMPCWGLVVAARPLGDAAEALCPHASHECVVEYGQEVLMREGVLDADDNPTLACAIRACFRTYAARPCFQLPAPRAGGDGGGGGGGGSRAARPEYETYHDVFAGVQRLAGVLAGATAGGDRVGICLAPGPWWYKLELAAVYAGRTACGMADCWGAADVLSCLARAAATAAFVDERVLAGLAGCSVGALPPSLRTIFVVPDAVGGGECARGGTDDALGCARLVRLDRATFRGVDAGPALPLPPQQARPPPTPDRPVVVYFSSGSSGAPKGALITEATYRRDIDVCGGFGRPAVAASLFVPAWGADKLTVWRALFNGARVGFAHAPLDSLFPRLAAVAPTELVLVPLLLEALQTSWHAARGRCLAAREAGGAGRSPPGRADAAAATAAACAHVYDDCLGGRLRSLGVGGAAVPPALLTWARAALPAWVSLHVGYGTSESGGISSDGKVPRGVEVRLIDVPELGYCTSDVPLPRGEVAVRTSAQVARESWLAGPSEMDAIRARYMPGGWFRTGDIGAMQADGSLLIIDRASSLVKLGNGQFLSPERVEAAVAAGCPCLSRAVALAAADGLSVVVVVRGGGDGAMQSHISDGGGAARVTLDDVRAACAGGAVQAHEVPSGVVVDTGPEWAGGGGPAALLTGNLKVARRAVALRFGVAVAAALNAAGGVVEVGGDGVVRACGGGSGDGEMRDRIGGGSGGGDGGGGAGGPPPLLPASAEALADFILAFVAGAGGGAGEMHNRIVGSAAGGGGAEAPAPARRDVRLIDVPCDSLAALRLRHRLSAMCGAGRGALAPATDLPGLPELLGSTPREIAAALWVGGGGGAAEAVSVPPPPPPPVARGLSRGVSLRPALSRALSSSERWPGADDSTGARAARAAGTIGDLGALAAWLGAAGDAITAAYGGGGGESPSGGGGGGAAVVPLPPRGDGVLLTGATGFLGRWLLGALLRALPDAVTVWCLVRGARGGNGGMRIGGGGDVAAAAAAEARLASAVAATGESWAALRARVRVVVGDAASRSLGLDAATYCGLARGCRVVVHAAAAVKFFPAVGGPGVALLEGANVAACHHILALASSCTPPMALLHVSTASVPAGRPLAPDALPALADPASGDLDAYSVTKAVAEAVVAAGAAAGGMRAVVARPGLLTWAVRGGVHASDDWLTRLVDTCVALRLAPAPPARGVAGWHERVPCSPVDAEAAGLAVLARVLYDAAPSGGNGGVALISAAPPEWALTPARVLDVVCAEAGAGRAPVHAWHSVVRGLPDAPFHGLASMIDGDGGALRLTMRAHPQSRDDEPHRQGAAAEGAGACAGPVGLDEGALNAAYMAAAVAAAPGAGGDGVWREPLARYVRGMTV